ncbi:MAG: hypothetical protein AAGF11_46175 [Myxococcota bacterium]
MNNNRFVSLPSRPLVPIYVPIYVMVLLLSACDEDDPPPSGGSGATTSDPAGSTGDDEPAPGDDSSTGAPVQPCDGLPSAQCEARPDCMVVEVDSNNEETCALGLPFPRCIEAGEPLSSSNRTTYFLQTESGIDYLFNGAMCIDGPPAVPVGWTECSGAPTDPQRCDCWCGAGDCPREEGILTLEACELPTLCGELVDHEYGEPFGEYTQCVFAALRDRTPGRLASNISDVIFYDRTLVYTDGSDQVQVLQRHATDVCQTLTHDTWGPTQSCTLKAPQFFDDCLAAGPSEQNENCIFSSNWTTDCQDVDPVCP